MRVIDLAKATALGRSGSQFSSRNEVLISSICEAMENTALLRGSGHLDRALKASRHAVIRNTDRDFVKWPLHTVGGLRHRNDELRGGSRYGQVAKPP